MGADRCNLWHLNPEFTLLLVKLNPGPSGPDVTGQSQAQTPASPWIPLLLTCECRRQHLGQPSPVGARQSTREAHQDGKGQHVPSSPPDQEGQWMPSTETQGWEDRLPRVARTALVILTAELWWWPPISVYSRCQAAFWGHRQLRVGGEPITCLTSEF